jgi:hypothetical protein
VLWASPAFAHPLTGGPSTPAQIGATAISIAAIAGGVTVMLRNPVAPDTEADRSSRLRRIGLITAGVGLASLLIAPDLVGPATPSCGRPATQARITILSPTQGQVIAGRQVNVQVRLTGGKFAPVASIKNRPGEGHLHLYIDGSLESMTGQSSQGLNLPPGRHEMKAEYVANDHGPFCRQVSDLATFTVRG